MKIQECLDSLDVWFPYFKTGVSKVVDVGVDLTLLGVSFVRGRSVVNEARFGVDDDQTT